jgi:RHS repeat-associated protein
VPIGFKSSSGTWNVSKETHYVYDGMLVVQERDGSNNPTVSYTRGKDLSGGRQGAGGIGGLLAYSSTSTGDHYYHSDALGNVTAMVNVNGALSASYEYDPYGNLLGAAGPMAGLNNYRFSSKELHQNSGLYAYGYRFYEPGFQRWLNRDPVGIRGGVNGYAFVGNKSMRFVDPFGLCNVLTGPMGPSSAGAGPGVSFGPASAAETAFENSVMEAAVAEVAAEEAAAGTVAAGGFSLTVASATGIGAVAIGGFSAGYYIGAHTGVGDWLGNGLAEIYDALQTQKIVDRDAGQWVDGNGVLRDKYGRQLPDQMYGPSPENKKYTDDNPPKACPVKTRNPNPIAKRRQFNSRKDAREAAEQASPIHQAVPENGPHGPHYHPLLDEKGNRSHDHYYFPDDEW